MEAGNWSDWLGNKTYSVRSGKVRMLDPARRHSCLLLPEIMANLLPGAGKLTPKSDAPPGSPGHWWPLHLLWGSR